MEERDVWPVAKGLALHTALKTEMEGGGCRHSADLSDLWKTAP